MGRPIKKQWFGDPDGAGYQLRITAKLPDTGVAEGFIISQKGTRKYLVDIGGVTGSVFLVNTLTAGNLADGEAFISATPFNGSPSAVSKLTQFRVAVWDTPDNDASTVSTYSWSEKPAENDTEATVISDATIEDRQATATVLSVGGSGELTGFTITDAGSGYTTEPEVTISGGNSDAVLTATVANGAVTSIVITDAGTGYDTGDVITIGPPV